MTTSSFKRAMGAHWPFSITSVDGNRWLSTAVDSNRLESTLIDPFESIPKRWTSTRPDRSAAFTLIELLMVVMLIAVLYSIILSAIRTVERHTLQTVTQAEIKNIETAWKQYFAHYQMWPTNTPDYLLDESLSKLLGGHEDAIGLNPDRMIFMEFTSVADHNNKLIPVNAWGESGRHKVEDCAYYVMFDEDGDNQLTFDHLGAGYTSTNIYRSVIVWSFNPARMQESSGTGSDKPKLLGSWMQ